MNCEKRLWTAFTCCLLSICFSNARCHAQNATDFYEPEIREVEGWTIKLDPQLAEAENREIADAALKSLANHLQRIAYIVPERRLDQLRTLPIWLELKNPVLESMQYHPSRRWLVEHGHNPDLEKHVHIPRAADLIDPGQWAKHPYVVLHELAHAYHDQYLDFDNDEIQKVYEKARDSGGYDEVLAHDGQTVKHYGMNNAKEYFAESTEAYFGVNDFYPFVRAELRQHDPTMFALLEKIWGEIGD
ncbi:MAG: metallopeptidase [Pirellulaceae bacterium]